jgi:hypothetical protein
MATQMVVSQPDDNNSIFATLRTHGWSRNMGGAVLGLFGGIIAPVFGSVFTAIGWISGPTWHGFAVQRIGTVLLFLTIPLLLFGAHCLDLSDREAKRAKSGHCCGEITKEPTKDGDHNDLERD